MALTLLSTIRILCSVNGHVWWLWRCYPQFVYSVQQCREVLAPKMEKTAFFISWSEYFIVLVSSFPLEQSDSSSRQQARCNTSTDISQRIASDRSRAKLMYLSLSCEQRTGSWLKGEELPPFITSWSETDYPCVFIPCSPIQKRISIVCTLACFAVLLTFDWR